MKRFYTKAQFDMMIGRRYETVTYRTFGLPFGKTVFFRGGRFLGVASQLSNVNRSIRELAEARFRTPSDRIIDETWAYRS